MLKVTVNSKKRLSGPRVEVSDAVLRKAADLIVTELSREISEYLERKGYERRGLRLVKESFEFSVKSGQIRIEGNSLQVEGNPDVQKMDKRIPYLLLDGTVLLRGSVFSEDLWIHPGIARNSVLNRGVKTGIEKAINYLVKKL